MKSFNEFVSNKTIDTLANSIVEHLTFQSEYYDPFDTLQSLFVEKYGKSKEYIFVEADGNVFGNKQNFWGILANKALGRIGQKITSGANAVKNFATSGANAVKNFAKRQYGNYQQNKQMNSLRDAYQKSVDALNQYITAINNLVPNEDNKSNILHDLNTLNKNLGIISNNIKNIILDNPNDEYKKFYV
jgi:hypothetical protein